MPELLAEIPLSGLDVSRGRARLTGCPIAPLWLYAPFPGSADAASGALQATLDMGLPRPGATMRAGETEARWAGRAQVLLIGPSGTGWAPAPELAAHGALTCVSDVYARMMLSGVAAPEVMARLVPLDLRPARFPQGATARSMLGHMTAQLTATGEGIEIMVMRSFAQSAAHEIETAMTRVAARP